MKIKTNQKPKRKSKSTRKLLITSVKHLESRRFGAANRILDEISRKNPNNIEALYQKFRLFRLQKSFRRHYIF